MTHKLTHMAAVAAALTALSACADFGGDYEPILDGQESTTYRQDLAECQQLSLDQPFQTDLIGAAFVGGLFGSALGHDEDDVTAAEGAAIGAAFGYAGGLFDMADQRKEIIVRCMSGRGHRVVG